ncbi:MAG: NADH-ubiquinone oxidoreductase, chain [Geminicoccaceae bacterium]|jgi:multicomponent K+:H+ antiporter subunit C|nr:NADH-ubiquinone oxidoreductase, chain [Geminicoccaceae bacterium]
MELLVASAIGLLTAVGVYLVLRRHSFPVIIGTVFLSYAVNLFLFATGRLAIEKPPIITPGADAYTDPLPQALVLTAIVISFGMTALIVVLALRAFLETGSDQVEEERSRSGEGRPRNERAVRA